MRNKFSGGFVLMEFAIALPLLILLGCGLAVVGLKIFPLGKDQTADYTLEAEAQHIIEQITKEVRTARKVEIKQYTDKIHRLKTVFETVNSNVSKAVKIKKREYKKGQWVTTYVTTYVNGDDSGGYESVKKSDEDDNDKSYTLRRIYDLWETRYFMPHEDTAQEIYDKLHAQRRDDVPLTSPISGDNTIGETKINRLEYKPYADKKILHITLELESIATRRKIKISTAVFMPNCEEITVK